MKSRFSFVQFLVFLAVLVLGIFSPLYAHRATPSANKTEKVSYNKSEFFADIAPTIQGVAEAYGVRPSLVIAQAALESDYGQNLLAVKYHNLFAAIYDYFDLLKSGKIRNSEGAYDVMVSNKGYKKPAQALQDMGFSSDPNYASKLIAIIEENDLTTYDK